jgi:hypothetical protein
MIRNTRFSLENRTRCVTGLLDKLNFIPYKDIIERDEVGKTVINGRVLDLEMARQIRESAKSLLDNQCRKIVKDQVAFKAVNIGVHNGDTPDKIIWSRVALWIYQQEDELLEMLSQ